MSAIFGIIRFDGKQVTDDSLKRMGAAMHTRGPDGIRQLNIGPAGLGHCLMRVTREDRFEWQPIEQDGLVLVADARIDNRDALAEALDIAPDRLERMADSDLILAAYREWGSECADHLLGDFIFAIWDDARQRLCLGRDPIGMRGLYWYQGDGFAAFATEAKALMTLVDVPRKLDDVRLMRAIVRDFRTGENSSPVTGLTTIRGGMIRCVSLDGVVSDSVYWEPHAAPEHVGRDAAYYHETYRKLLIEAIDCRLRRLLDPPGLLLSGGFDSAIIAGIAGQGMAGTGHRMLTITSAMGPDERDASHRDSDARRGAQWCVDHMPHLDHNWWVQSDEDFLKAAGTAEHVGDDVPLQLGFVFDEMYRDLRSRGARTAFDGIGGDETVNPRIRSALASLWRARRWGQFWREARIEARSAHVGALRLAIGVMLPQWLRRLVRGRRGVDGVHWTSRYCVSEQLEAFVEAGDVQLPKQVIVGDLGARLRTLELLRSRARQNNANEAAAQGLELVRPMLDRRLIEFGLAVPDSVQRVNGRYRALARAALADILPPEFATRPPGQEMLLPGSERMIRGAASAMREDLIRWQDRPELSSHLRIDRLVADLAPDRVETADGIQLAVIARMYLTARYIAWFRGLN